MRSNQPLVCNQCGYRKLRKKKNYPFGMKSKPTITRTCRRCGVRVAKIKKKKGLL